MSHADSQLLERWQAGDAEAFQEIVRQYSGLVFRAATTDDPGGSDSGQNHTGGDRHSSTKHSQHDGILISASEKRENRRTAWIAPFEFVYGLAGHWVAGANFRPRPQPTALSCAGGNHCLALGAARFRRVYCM